MSNERVPEHLEGRTSRQEVEIEAPAERVWEAWTDPQRIADWFVDRARGPVAEGETFTWFWDKYGIEVPSEVVTVEPGERLVLRAPWGPGRATVLEVALYKAGGRTRVRTIHSGFGKGADWDDEYEGTHSGWRMALGVLKHYVEAHFGEPRLEFLLRRVGDFEASTVRSLYHTAEGLSRWLALGGELGLEGGEVRLELREAGALSGRVLARPKNEILFSWTEEEAVLELKSYGTPDGRAVALRGSGWSRPQGWRERMERDLAPALERLVEILQP